MAHDPLQVGTLTAEPGQRAYGYVAVRAAGVDLQIPIFLICGAQPGPTLSVTAGIHGAEYASVEAALRLGRTLDPATLRGRVIVAPIANTLAFAARSIYITPPDGKNLNRQFPGLANGTFTQALAYWLFQEVIQQGDAFIDLHGGDMIEALVPFVIHYRSGDAALDQAAVALARAFALPYVVPSESGGGTYSAAAGAGSRTGRT